MWWWGFQVLLTNSYVLYQNYHKLHDRSEYAADHMLFIDMIARAWLEPAVYWPHKDKVKQGKAEAAQGEVRLFSPTSSSISSSRRSLRSNLQQQQDCKKRKKNARVSDAALDPIKGSLNKRLDHAYYRHWPSNATTQKPRCQVHRWAIPKKKVEKSIGEGNVIEIESRPVVMKGVHHCIDCSIDLCVGCWEAYHTIANVNELREEIQDMAPTEEPLPEAKKSKDNDEMNFTAL